MYVHIPAAVVVSDPVSNIDLVLPLCVHYSRIPIASATLTASPPPPLPAPYLLSTHAPPATPAVGGGVAKRATATANANAPEDGHHFYYYQF